MTLRSGWILCSGRSVRKGRITHKFKKKLYILAPDYRGRKGKKICTSIWVTIWRGKKRTEEEVIKFYIIKLNSLVFKNKEKICSQTSLFTLCSHAWRREENISEKKVKKWNNKILGCQRIIYNHPKMGIVL